MLTKQKYYSLDRILAKNCQYNMIIGQRSNGKTYAALKLILQNYCYAGKQGVILRRFDTDFQGTRGQQMFAGHVSNGEISKLTGGKWADVYYYGGKWYLCKYHDDKKGERKRTIDKKPFAFGMSISSVEHDKSTSYPDVTTIVFDEFLTRKFYLQDEFVLFCNVLSTIIRDRTDVRVFMLGNTVNKYCPYFSEMGLTNVTRMKQGTIDVYSYGDSGLHVAVEYCAERKSTTGSDDYFCFGNPRLEMIKNGMWELDLYPHLPHKYAPKNVLYTAYIDFSGELLTMEIILVDNNYFMFVHPKTTPLKEEPDDIIYTDKYNPAPNYRRSLLRSGDKISIRIRQFFEKGQVYYSDNETGEIMRNYLKWAAQNK